MSTPFHPIRTDATVPARLAVVRDASAPSGFQAALRQAKGDAGLDSSVVIRPGDTLRGLIRAHSPTVLSEAEMGQRVSQVAKANGLSDPNKIIAGRRLDLSVLNSTSAPTGRSVFTPMERSGQRPSSPQTSGVLSRTLDRAVDKGYVLPKERAAVEQRIIKMGRTYGFSPDDFARVVLMESDGLNPKASNGRCHGIIQFCEGASRGADSVGLRGRAHEIAKMSVSQQLSLVEAYFEDVGLKRAAPNPSGARPPQRLGLDDLYLSVLTPSARQEARPHAPLNIAGQQASALYVGSDRDQSITRASLSQGLQRHAQRVLAQHDRADSGKPLAAGRQQLAAQRSYLEVAVLDVAPAKTGLSKP